MLLIENGGKTGKRKLERIESERNITKELSMYNIYAVKRDWERIAGINDRGRINATQDVQLQETKKRINAFNNNKKVAGRSQKK